MTVPDVAAAQQNYEAQQNGENGDHARGVSGHRYRRAGFAPRRRMARPKPPTARFSLGLENVFGYSTTTQQLTLESSDANKTVTERSTLSFLGGGQTNPFALPTLSMDLLLPIGLTVGLGIHYLSDGAESKSESRLTTTTLVTTTKYSTSSLGGQIRVGASLETARLRFWPRVGLAWQETTTTTTASSDQSATGTSVDVKVSGQALTVELPVVLMLGGHGGFALGPALYMPVGGSYESGAQTGKVMTSGFAINASGYFTL